MLYDVPTLTGLFSCTVHGIIGSSKQLHSTRVINIKAIVEITIRGIYMNQEEEFLQENSQYRDIDGSHSSSYTAYTSKQNN